MPEIRPISVVACLDAAAGLMQAHQLETEPGMSSDGPHPLGHVYAALELAGNVVAFGAFEGDELVGYSVAIIGPHLHYGYLYAHHDVLYVRPESRKGTVGLRLIRATEAESMARGARCVTWHVKPGSRLEAILSRTGYSVEETVYRKEF